MHFRQFSLWRNGAQQLLSSPRCMASLSMRGLFLRRGHALVLLRRGAMPSTLCWRSHFCKAREQSRVGVESSSTAPRCPTFNINPNQPVDWSPPVCILDTWLYRPRLALDVLRSESIRYLSQFQLVLGGIEVVWIEPRTSHPLPMLSFGTPNSGGGLPDARYYSGGI